MLNQYLSRILISSALNFSNANSIDNIACENVWLKKCLVYIENNRLRNTRSKLFNVKNTNKNPKISMNSKINVIGKLESSSLKTTGCSKTSINVCTYVVLEHKSEYKLIRD